MFNIFDIIALIIAGLHFGVPIIYYFYLKVRWLQRSWNIRMNLNYKPKVTIVIPTYNEARYIEKKLENIYQQRYPKEKMKVIVVDSNSNDGTVDIVRKWSRKHNDLPIEVIQENKREGKLKAILKALPKAIIDSDLIILTDADAFWDRDAITNAVKYFADPQVGVVTASMRYLQKRHVEDKYRMFYNIVRICESKIHSTPVHNGPFQMFRSNLLRRYFIPDFSGADDSSFGSYIAFTGYRAIQVDDVIVYEPLRHSTFRRKVRRAQHLIVNFMKTKKFAIRKGVYKKSIFDKIWKIEWYLNIINPWLLLTATIMLIFNAVYNKSVASVLTLIFGGLFMFVDTFSVWITQQIYLIIALIKNLHSIPETW
ncbi:glycosyltransferase [Desulfurococcaceae archaeon MEX13E-LK6-19]|nr:glycosyltransferase [Desulfurococcaceae archaeon MEX13E-LK6-19]